MSMIWLIGDTHGKLGHILDALRSARQAGTLPTAMIFLGDIEAKQPFPELAKPIENFGVEVWFIHGNHDVDNPSVCGNLLDSAYANRNLHGRVAEIAGIRVAGLGGVFESPIWLPNGDQREPTWLSYDDYANHEQQQLCKNQAQILAGRLLKHRGSIFYDTYCELHGLSAECLVTHEAPSCHPCGYQEIDELARSLGASKAFHGHHHERPDYTAHWPKLGFQAYAVGYRGISDINGNIVRPGESD